MPNGPATLPGDALLAWPDSPSAIDLATLTSLPATTTFQLAQVPQSGEVTFEAGGLLIYTPNGAFVAGNDAFSLSISTSAGGSTVPIQVAMTTDAQPTPCQAGAVPDRIETTIGKAVTVPVLKNDVACSGRFDVSTLRVRIGPRHGTATVQGEEIRYTPTAGYSGRDRLIYEICDGRSPAGCNVAVVTFLVGAVNPNCRIALRNDVARFWPVFVGDTLPIPVLANDQLCATARTGVMSVVKAPVNGSATLKGRFIVYRASNYATLRPDSLRYRYCVGSQCTEAVVQIQPRATAANCQLTAQPDGYRLPLARLQQSNVKAVPIPVLLNDQLCQPLTALRITDNPDNARIEQLPGGIFLYYLSTPLKTGILRFSYASTDITGSTAEAVVRLTITE